MHQRRHRKGLKERTRLLAATNRIQSMLLPSVNAGTRVSSSCSPFSCQQLGGHGAVSAQVGSDRRQGSARRLQSGFVNGTTFRILSPHPPTPPRGNVSHQKVSILPTPPSKSLGEIGILLPNNQRQHRTLHIQKDVLSYALC